MLRHLIPSLALAALPAVAFAQGASYDGAGTDSLYLKAQRLVVNGNGADGRAIVDSLFRSATPGSADYAEALYWKAALADNAAEAERGYLRLTIEYPLSPRTEAALLRLGQLELTRGNKQLALSRFERAAREFPTSAQRARTEYTMARVYLDDRRMREGCTALNDARSALSEDDVELRNQVEYLGRQCVGVSLEPEPQPAPAAARAGQQAATQRPQSRPAPTTTPTATSATPAPTPAAPAPVADRLAEPTPTAAPAPAPTVAPTRAPAPPPPAHAGWSVQVAAFDREEPARELAEQLRRDGFDARVDADEQWHRVRIGRYATREQAAAQARALKARGVTGFVTGVSRE